MFYGLVGLWDPWYVFFQGDGRWILQRQLRHMQHRGHMHRDVHESIRNTCRTELGHNRCQVFEYNHFLAYIVPISFTRRLGRHYVLLHKASRWNLLWLLFLPGMGDALELAAC